MWKELKADVTELARTRRVTVDNEHVLKLVNKVEELTTVSKK